MKLPRDASGEEVAEHLGMEREELVESLFGN